MAARSSQDLACCWRATASALLDRGYGKPLQTQVHEWLPVCLRRMQPKFAQQLARLGRCKAGFSAVADHFAFVLGDGSCRNRRNRLPIHQIGDQRNYCGPSDRASL
jgi:hypothetical protein